MMKPKILSIVALATVLSACGSIDTRFTDHEKLLGTDGGTSLRQHRVVHDPHGLGFRFPGMLVAIEKAQKKIGHAY